jgi:predicted Zn-dependent protease with MMP-like domain
LASSVTDFDRQRFDELLEQVLAELPESVTRLLDEVPLMVEDYPSQKVVEDMGLAHRDELCGLYSGIPLIERSVEQSGQLSDCVTIYREGILRVAREEDPARRIRKENVRRQIRITILHELGHHHGLDEEELDELGYG